MANITQVDLTSGVPTGPSGAATVSTIDALMADGGQATLGATTGAAVITDASGTLQQYLRGLVKLFAAAVAGVAGALFTKLADGSGNLLTSTSNALDINIKSGSVAAKQDYQDIPQNSGVTTLIGQSGTTGAADDWLDFVDVFPQTTSPGAVLLADGSGLAASASWTTASTTITMAAALPSWVIAGHQVYDTTNNELIGTVASGAGTTTLTLAAAAAFASSGAADNLLFCMPIFPGGASSVVSLWPSPIAVKSNSKRGAWRLITFANVMARVGGNFS